MAKKNNYNNKNGVPVSIQQPKFRGAQYDTAPSRPQEEPVKQVFRLEDFLLRYLLPFVIGGGVFFAYVALLDIFNKQELYDIYLLLSNGATLVGVSFVGVGLLIFSANEGTLDGLAYSAGSFFRQLIPGVGLLNPRRNYKEFIKDRHKKKMRFLHLIIVGAVFILIAIIFTLLYNGVAPPPLVVPEA